MESLWDYPYRHKRQLLVVSANVGPRPSLPSQPTGRQPSKQPGHPFRGPLDGPPTDSSLARSRTQLLFQVRSVVQDSLHEKRRPTSAFKAVSCSPIAISRLLLKRRTRTRLHEES